MPAPHLLINGRASFAPHLLINGYGTPPSATYLTTYVHPHIPWDPAIGNLLDYLRPPSQPMPRHRQLSTRSAGQLPASVNAVQCHHSRFPSTRRLYHGCRQLARIPFHCARAHPVAVPAIWMKTYEHAHLFVLALNALLHGCLAAMCVSAALALMHLCD